MRSEPADKRVPEFECPECRGEGRVEDGFVSAHDVYGDAEIETRVVPCGLCRATGRITRAAMSVYQARGGIQPVKPRRFA